MLLKKKLTLDLLIPKKYNIPRNKVNHSGWNSDFVNHLLWVNLQSNGLLLRRKNLDTVEPQVVVSFSDVVIKSEQQQLMGTGGKITPAIAEWR